MVPKKPLGFSPSGVSLYRNWRRMMRSGQILTLSWWADPPVLEESHREEYSPLH
jgi:hypothetical protein